MTTAPVPGENASRKELDAVLSGLESVCGNSMPADQVAAVMYSNSNVPRDVFYYLRDGANRAFPEWRITAAVLYGASLIVIAIPLLMNSVYVFRGIFF